MENSITIRIENFRSLKDVTLDLNDVNLFIGPNNSGKTNIFKALQFLGEWLRIGEVGNFQEICFGKNIPFPFGNKNNYKPLAFTIQYKDSSNDAYEIYKVEFFMNEESGVVSSYQLVGMTNFHVVKNNFVKNYELKIADVASYQSWFYAHEIYFRNFEHGIILRDLDEKIINHITKTKNLAFKQGEYQFERFDIDVYYRFWEKSYLGRTLALGVNYTKAFTKIDGFYSIRVDKIRDAAKYEKSIKVAYDASNLVSFIDDMDNNYPSVLDNIKKDFRACIGNEFSNFKCPVFENKVTPLRKLKFFDTEGNDYWADEVSDGVLYFLAIVCILHQPDPPHFLLLEEPENGIHPRRIKNIMDYIFDLAEEKNISVIMTSHSPVVLDEFKDVPENVFVFDKNKTSKATEVVNLNDFIEGYNEKAKTKSFSDFPKNASLGDYWLIGLINGVPTL